MLQTSYLRRYDISFQYIDLIWEQILSNISTPRKKDNRNNFQISSFWHQKVRWALITFQPSRGKINSHFLYARDSSLQVPVLLTCQGQADWSVYYPKQIEHFNHFQSHFCNVHVFALKRRVYKSQNWLKKGQHSYLSYWRVLWLCL